MTAQRTTRKFAIARRIVVEQIVTVEADTPAEAMRKVRAGHIVDDTTDGRLIKMTCRHVADD